MTYLSLDVAKVDTKLFQQRRFVVVSFCRESS